MPECVSLLTEPPAERGRLEGCVCARARVCVSVCACVCLCVCQFILISLTKCVLRTTMW